MNNPIIASITALSLWGIALSSQAMELEPRRWGHIPAGINFVGGGYARTEGDIIFDPVLRAENVEMEMDSWVFRYVRGFEFANKSASFSLAQAHHDVTWTGLLDGVPTTVHRSGLSDPILRLAINLKGAPPLSGKEYQAYRARQDIETIIGAGLSLQLPVGEYLDDKLLNLGSNRFTTRVRTGVVHKRGKWLMELTGGMWIYSENDEFFGGNNLEQDPLFTLQGHLIHNFRPGIWAGLSIGYAYGAESTVNGEDKDDRQRNAVWGLSYGFPISSRVSGKIGYIGSRTRSSTGQDSDSIAIGISTAW